MPCGCSFKILGPPPLPKCDLPSLEVDWDNVPLDCKATYDLISSGKTKMVFQLEKGGGRQGSKELKPDKIEDMSALGAVLRPGASSNFDQDGISTTKHFYLRKNNLEEIKPYHPVIDEILKDTYGCLIYQEQSMKIAEAVAGFNKQEADNLRKAIGKKLAEEMAKVKKWFIDGAKKAGILTDAQAEEVFGWIQESQRYSFNKCLSLDTIVETTDGLKTLEEVEIGDFVKTPEGFSEILDKIDNGVKELYEVTLESGKTIECTLDHIFLCENMKEYPLWKILKLKLKIMCDSEELV